MLGNPRLVALMPFVAKRSSRTCCFLLFNLEIYALLAFAAGGGTFVVILIVHKAILDRYVIFLTSICYGNNPPNFVAAVVLALGLNVCSVLFGVIFKTFYNI